MERRIVCGEEEGVRVGEGVWRGGLYEGRRRVRG